MVLHTAFFTRQVEEPLPSALLRLLLVLHAHAHPGTDLSALQQQQSLLSSGTDHTLNVHAPGVSQSASGQQRTPRRVPVLGKCHRLAL